MRALISPNVDVVSDLQPMMTTVLGRTNASENDRESKREARQRHIWQNGARADTPLLAVDADALEKDSNLPGDVDAVISDARNVQIGDLPDGALEQR